jgi:hypothetical protein
MEHVVFGNEPPLIHGHALSTSSSRRRLFVPHLVLRFGHGAVLVGEVHRVLVELGMTCLPNVSIISRASSWLTSLGTPKPS